jgi:pentatricopeptide repeat protein
MGGYRGGCNVTRHSAIEYFCIELKAYNVKDGQPKKAIELFQQMQQEGISPHKFSFVLVINVFAGLEALEDGRLVHEQLIQIGCKCDVFV